MRRALGSIDPVSCTDEACLFYLGFDPGGIGQLGWAVGTTEDLALPIERVHGLPITETHPKALLWLLGITSPARGHADVPLADVGESRGDSNGHDVSFDLDF